ncbi:MAG: hypothetical protein ABIF01_03515, partial [Candidatus Micrarchaeota archaeon]
MDSKGLTESPDSGGLDAVIAIVLSLFTSVARLIGVYFAISFFIILAALGYDALRFLLTFLKVLFTKRPEGTSFIDALSYEFGKGEETRGI